jgi:hypothetical protein
LILFAVAALVAFAFPFFKDGTYKQLTFVPDMARLKSFAVVLLPFLALMAAAQSFKIEAGSTLRYFAGAAMLPFIFARLKLPPRLSGVLLLAAAVVLTRFDASSAGAPACFAVIAGLLIWKVAENLLLGAESSLEDVIPPVTWLVGLNWIRTAMTQAQYESREGLLLGALAVVLLLRIFQTPFLTNDKLYLKRIILAATGGLGLLIVINKLLSLPLNNSLCPIAALFGAGIFVAYLFDGMQKDQPQVYGGSEAVTALVLVGILSVVASRIFGNFGLIMLAPAMLVGMRGGFAHSAAAFFAARGLMQVYILTDVQNVTGINLMHAYSSAALFAGFLVAVVLSVAVRDMTDRRWLTTIFLACGSIVPLMSNYFLHEEPTGSLLVSSLVAAMMLVTLGPPLYKQAVAGHENLLLLPASMTSFALLGSQLISMGTEGTAEDKIKILLYCAVIFLVFSGLLYWFFSRSPKKPVEAS